MSNQFILYQSNSLTSLAEEFAKSLRQYRTNPLRSESVIIQTTGMETWLTQQCARINNIFAGVEFTRPAKFLLKLNAILTGESEERTVFESENMRWFIFRELSENIADYPLVEQYLRGGDGEVRQQKLFTFASETAELLDSYILYRPEMLEAWSRDEFHSDAMGNEIFSFQEREHEVWQRNLWRAMLRFHQESDSKGQNPVEVLSRLGRILSAEPTPELIRWSRSVPVTALFGMSVLPPRYMELFKLLSRHCRVELYVINPSRFYWSDILTDRQVAYRKKQMELCSPDKEYFTMGNRLLRNLGESGRDFYHTLYETAEHINIHEEELFAEPDEGTLLGEIQRDILEWHDDGRESKVELSGDDSITINRCYTPFREVEVLYDYILSILEKDPSLTLGDILIVTPDIETYAPLITLQFSRNTLLNGSVADMSALAQSSILQLIREILLLPESTYSAPTIISLFEQYARFTGEELAIQDEAKIKKWVEESGIRWGVDGEFWQSRSGSMFGYDRFSWKSGLNRMFQGYAAGDDLFPLPSYSEIEGSDAELLGRLSAFVRTVSKLWGMSSQIKSVTAWSEQLTLWFRELFLFDEGEHEDLSDPILSEIIQQIHRIETQVEIILNEAAPFTVGFSTIRSALFRLLEEEDGARGFLRGDITFASTLPLRSIPFRVVGCIGMNYDLFPRVGNALSFDLIRAARHRGDRDTRQNDLYLFLETVISAEDKFYLSYTAFNEKSGEEQPPSSVLDQLENYIHDNYLFGSASPLESIRSTHPLHPFSQEYLREGSRLFTYQEKWFPKEGSETLFNASLFDQKFISKEYKVDFENLLLYYSDPLFDLFENILGVSLPESSESLPDEEPFNINTLHSYLLREAGVKSTIEADGDYHSTTSELYYRGDLPAGSAYDVCKNDIGKAIDNLISRIPVSLIGKEPEQITFFGGENENCATLLSEPLYLDSDNYYLIDVGDLKFVRKKQIVGKLKRYFKLYLSHLIINSCKEGTTHLITRDSSVCFPPINKTKARNQLEQLVGQYQKSRTSFLPYFGTITNELFSTNKLVSEIFEDRVENAGYDRSPDPYEKLFWAHHKHLFTSHVEEQAQIVAKQIFSPLDMLQGGK